MKSVYIIAHQSKPQIAEIVRRVTDSLHSNGIYASAEPWLRGVMEASGDMFVNRNISECSAILALGGDGTLLRASSAAVKHDLPLLGVNVGTVGFLTVAELEQADEAFARFARDDYSIESRMLLDAELKGRHITALNDIVVSRGGYSRLIGVNAWVDEQHVGRFVGDGLIVSTPTGSTGYSLSAGGPIVCPELDCLMLTPICAHSLQHRPVITSPSSKITISLDEEHSSDALVSIDGMESYSLPKPQKLIITRSERQAKFIRFESSDFFAKIRYKLSEWSC